MTDVLPWWFALALCGFDGMKACPPAPRAVRFAEVRVAVLLVCLGCCINLLGATCAGPANWNYLPANIDEQPSRLWDWMDPPFLRPIRTTFAGTSTGNVSEFH